MKKFLCIIAALALVAGSCSKGDDEQPTPETPTTPVIEPGSDSRPGWQAPDYHSYEQTMTVLLYLQDELVPYAGSQDLICATVGNEVRGVAAVEKEGEQPWIALTIGGHGEGESISLSYYCDLLHRIFTLPDSSSFDSSVIPSGTTELYTPRFVK